MQNKSKDDSKKITQPKKGILADFFNNNKNRFLKLLVVDKSHQMLIS